MCLPRRARRAALVLCVLALCGPVGARRAQAAPPGQAPPVVQQWRMFEITLTSTERYDNPFLDVSVTGVFTSPTGTVLTRPGFWDGGNTWRVRVALTELGEWDYAIASSNPADAGLTQTGRLQCVPYDGPHAVYRHGFLRVSDNGRYLAHADGTPFFWLGDTHWLFDSKERWDEANKPGWESQFRGMVDRRIEQRFTVYQSAIFSTGARYWATGAIGERIDPEYFRRELDRKMAYIAERGLVNAFGLGWHRNIDGQVLTIVRAAEYVVARYGAYPMVWITGGEVAGYEPALRQQRLDAWREVALTIDRLDAYQHPQTAHYTNSWPTYYQDEPWFDFTMLQSAHDLVVEPRIYWRYYQQYPDTPLLEGELNYEAIRPRVDASMVRQSAYRAIQAGSFGYTYGAHGIWNATWDNTDTDNDDRYQHRNWYDAIDFAGGYQMAHLAEFYTRLPWHTLEPRPADWAAWAGTVRPHDMPLVKADDEAKVVVAFLPDAYDTDGPAGALLNLTQPAYSVQWFNPRTGQYQPMGVAALAQPTWTIEAKPDGQDWLLLLRASRAPQPHPELPRLRRLRNLAAQGQYSSTTHIAQNVAAMAFDGDLTTLWQADPAAPAAEQWVEVAFDQPTTFNSVVLTEDGYQSRGFRLEYWTGEAWQTVAEGRLIGDRLPTVKLFRDVTATRLRVRYTSAAAALNLVEFEVYHAPRRWR